ncbi:hypothetical protein AMATHDRAFT_74451 [Amanita thiersii Skay4041]|uniref:Trafficking protein particle complex subunit 11 domain-containing protein n=1 Tax=Amanita thiersii Skay4041 TaxID=703135 RepID=A0A2A9NWM3_9AGAR|nr:hypothetical protein AMATHDRAFT_74451 [Amanita thiersii Skay4041]
MNSYPPELLVQLAPVMFVAGLDVAPTGKPQDAFAVLYQRLREALLAQWKPTIWQPERSKTFQVVIVDKDVRFPPRKLVPPDDPQYPSSHSPLSPLTPSSPLHPDGLIAPIWIRKHTNLVPSVLVLFLRMYETPLHNPRSPLDVPDTDRDREREQEERKRDSELAAEVALRKKSTNERGIKLTVVLIASRKMLDDLTLDSRLTFIRRQSGLDSRAALFVLSPVSPSELVEFVSSLQQALYEPAIDYYTAHSKRVRRKRNRHSQAPAPYSIPTSSTNIARPLRPEGWTVRYEYKMGCFAEFRGENEVALKHYQDAYEMLVIMFGSTVILPPRTKRWAEAKVLSDCINIKIGKLYLYNNEHSLALSHHSTHMRKFGDFSRGWGIGEDTFEFWSWMARQHRVFAELLEQGTNTTLVIPEHRPTALMNNATSIAASTYRGGAGSTLEIETLRSLGLNPSHTLQHPGFYYYMAAQCTEMRREKYLVAVDAELNQQIVTSPSFTNEKKVQHNAIILELYTKSYELFKKYSSTSENSTQSRLTLWIAYRIAQTYYDSGEFGMAVRFFERIAKTYRREKWDIMLCPLLSTWYTCAKELGDVELGVKLLIEMLAQDTCESDELDPSDLEKDLVALLKRPLSPSSERTLVVDLSESQPLFDACTVFWNAEVQIGEQATFQISLTAPKTVTISSIPFSSLVIHLSGAENPITVRHIDATNSSSKSSASIRMVDLGDVTHYKENPIEVETELRWKPGNVLVFCGRLKSDAPATINVTKLELAITQDVWKVQIPCEPCTSRRGSRPVPRWLCFLDQPHFVPIDREEFSSITFKHRSPDIGVTFRHNSPAYLNEEYPIDISVINDDDRRLNVVVDVLLLPSEEDDAISTIMMNEQRSSSLIKGIPFGVLHPAASATKTLYLTSSGSPANRVLDISVRSWMVTGDGENPEVDHNAALDYDNAFETLETLVVPTVDAFKTSHNVVYRRCSHEWVGLADLRTFDADFWDDRGGEAVIDFRIESAGPWTVKVESIVLERENGPSCKVIDSSLDCDEDAFPSEFVPGDEYGDVCRIGIAISEGEAEQGLVPGPGKYVIQWRRIMPDDEKGTLSTSIYYLPPLHPPSDGLIALLKLPPVATLHVPIPMVLLIRNLHKHRSANITVHLETDGQDAFIVAGLRNGRIPILLPGSEEKIVWQLVPVECGYVKVPRIRVVDRRRTLPQTSGGEAQGEGELVRVVDVRWRIIPGQRYSICFFILSTEAE